MMPRTRFEPIRDAVIPIQSYHDLKREVRDRYRQWHGMPIIRCRIVRDAVQVQTECPDKTLIWNFFGYVEDVAYNIQKGLVPTEKE